MKEGFELTPFIGSSVIMYKNKELRRHQYYIQPDWAGGEPFALILTGIS
jgi:hypothetical protein